MAALFESLPAGVLITLLAAAAAIGLAVLWWRAKRSAAQEDALAAEAVDTLIGWTPQATRVLTPSELRACALLSQALPQHLIFAQLSLARFIKVPTRHSYAEWLRRVGHLSADLVVCDMHSQVIAVVEVRPLRERGGERGERRQQRFARVLKAVGIPLHVWIENALPDVEQVRLTILPKPLPADAKPPREAEPPAMVPALPPESDFEVTQHPPADEVIEMREPPSSTWFDEFDSGVAPLDPPRARKR